MDSPRARRRNPARGGSVCRTCGEGGTSPKRDRAGSTTSNPNPLRARERLVVPQERLAPLGSSEPSAPARPAPALLRPAHRLFTQSLRAFAESRMGTRNTRNSAKKDPLLRGPFSCFPRLFRVFRVLHPSSSPPSRSAKISSLPAPGAPGSLRRFTPRGICIRRKFS